MLLTGFFSGLATQSELDDLLDMLYGSYGERLIVSYKEQAKGVQSQSTPPYRNEAMLGFREDLLSTVR
jgi:hypothetical protein